MDIHFYSYWRNHILRQFRKNYHEILLGCIEIVDSEIEKGASFDEMINNDVLSKWKSWERAFTTEELIGFIYQSLLMNSKN